MPDLIVDKSAWPVVAGLVDAITRVFEERGIPAERVIAMHGPQATFDISEECVTQGWVRLMTEFPSQSFPQQDATPPSLGRGFPVAQNNLVVQLEVGAAHCSVQWELGDEAYIPTAEEYASDTELSLSEMSSLRYAICSYLASTRRRFLLGGYTPYAGGGIIGGTWSVLVESSPEVDG